MVTKLVNLVTIPKSSTLKGDAWLLLDVEGCFLFWPLGFFGVFEAEDGGGMIFLSSSIRELEADFGCCLGVEM